MKQREWPYVVDVAPIVPGFQVLRFLVDTPAACDERIAFLLGVIHEAGDRWVADPSVLLRCMQSWHAVDALLDARLELERVAAGTPEVLHAQWVLSWPGSAAPSGDLLDQASGVAAA